MLSLYAYSRKSQELCYKNIAQKSAADFMQIDETDIGIKIPASYDGQPGKMFHCLNLFSININHNAKFFFVIFTRTPHLSIDVLNKNYILELYKMTICEYVQII